jgi:hypothetical protein
MYRSSADTIGFSTNGLSRVTLNTVRLLTDLPIYNQDGNVGAPAYSFTNDTDSGLFRLGANDIRLSTGGVARMIWNDTINYSRVVFQNVDGTSGTPAYSFEADPDTGIYRNASNDMRFVAGGAAVATMLSTGFFAQQLAFFPDGLVGGPGISFTSDTNTGIYRLAADYMGFTAGGILAFAARLVAATPQLMIIDGTIANPSLAFDADVDTGFYRAATNDMAMSVGGIQAFRAANVAGVTNITIGAPSAAGTFSWNTNTSASATAGSSGALPAQVDGYISVNLNGANRKIPFYAN